MAAVRGPSSRIADIILCAALLSALAPAPEVRAGSVKVAAGPEVLAVPNMGPGRLGSELGGAGLRVQGPTLTPRLGSSLSGLAPAPAAIAPISPVAPAVIPQAPVAPSLQAPVAPMAKLTESVQAEVSVIEKPGLPAEGSSAAGQRVEDIITGGRSVAGSGEAAGVVLAAPADNGAPPQLQPAAVGPSAQKAAPAKPAQTAPAVKSVGSRSAYGAHRLVLGAVASLFGVVASLPETGPDLARRVLADAASRRVVFSDFDDTLGPYNSVLTPEMAAALAAVRRSGKEVAVITDRTDVAGGHQLSAFESLATIPAADRAGMYVAAVSGGKVYRYNSQGEPQLLWEYPPFDEARRQPVVAAISGLKARLGELGTSQHPGDAKNPAESWQPYSYAMMLTVGTPAETVKKAGRLFEAELKKVGLDVSVNARVPKDPANPPYIQFSIVDKSASVGYIAKALGVEPWEALALGDNMYLGRTPDQPGRLSGWARRLAEALSGRPIPPTGNETDRNMEKALPGLLALSVGGTADPRLSRAYVLPGRGAASSLEVLRAVASRPAAAADPNRYWKLAGAAAVVALVVAGIFLGWWAFWKAFYEAAAQGLGPWTGGPF